MEGCGYNGAVLCVVVCVGVWTDEVEDKAIEEGGIDLDLESVL